MAVIDDIPSLMLGLATLAAGFWLLWRTKRGPASARFRERHWSRRGLSLTGRTLLVLLGLLIALNGTVWMRARICIGLTEGQEWCNYPQPSGEDPAGD